MPYKSLTSGYDNVEDNDLEYESESPGIGRSLLNAVLTPIEVAGTVLGYPGSVVRGGLAGKGLGSFVEWTSGRDLLDAWGVFPKGEGFDFTGLAADFIDPFLFAGSITGLTKLGKVTQEISRTTKALNEVKGLAAVSRDAKAIEGYNALIDSMEKSITKLTARLPEAFTPGVDKAAQFASGERGLTASLPFGKSEVFIPKVGEKINSLIEPVIKLLPIPKFTKLRELFSTERKTKVGQFLFDEEKRQFAHSIGAAADFVGETKRDIADIVKTTNLTEPQVLTKLVTAIELSPEKIRGRIDTVKAMYDTTLSTKLNSINDYWTARVANLDAKSAAKLQTAWQNDATKAINAINTKRVAEVSALEDKLVKAIEVAKDIEPPIQAVANKFRGLTDEFLAVAQASKVGVTANDEIIHYIARSSTPEFKAYLNKRKDYLGRAKRIVGGTLGYTKERKIRDMTLPEVNELLFKETGVRNAFHTDPRIIAENRRFLTDASITTARNIHFVANFHAKDFPSFEDFVSKGNTVDGEISEWTVKSLTKEERAAARQEYRRAWNDFKVDHVTLPTMYQRAHLSGMSLADGTSIDWGILPHQGGVKAVRDAMKAAGGGIERRGVPKELYNDLIRMNKSYLTSGFWKYWDDVSNLHRVWFTSLSPAYLGTNILGTIWANFVSGIGVKHYPEAMRAIINERVAKNPQSWLRRFVPETETFFHGSPDATLTKLDPAYTSVSKKQLYFTKDKKYANRYSIKIDKKGKVYELKIPKEDIYTIDKEEDLIKLYKEYLHNSPLTDEVKERISRVPQRVGNSLQEKIDNMSLSQLITVIRDADFYSYIHDIKGSKAIYNKIAEEGVIFSAIKPEGEFYHGSPVKGLTELKPYSYFTKDKGYAGFYIDKTLDGSAPGTKYQFNIPDKNILELTPEYKIKLQKQIIQGNPKLQKEFDYLINHMDESSAYNTLVKNEDLIKPIENAGYSGFYDSITTEGVYFKSIKLGQQLFVNEKTAMYAKELIDGGYGGTNFLRDAADVRPGQSKLIDNWLTSRAASFNNFNDDVGKLAHYISKREEGLSPLAAGESVKKYLFDHSDITRFEKDVMKRFVLFYTFARKNLPLAMYETFFNQKAYFLNKLSYATLDSEPFVPEYVKNSGQIYLGNDQFIDIRNPLFEANRFSPQGQGITRSLERVASQLVPQLKIPLEMVFGREFFTGRSLQDATRIGEGYAGLPLTRTFTNKEGRNQTFLNPTVHELLRNLPVARLTQSAGDILNPEVSALSLVGPRLKTLPLGRRKLQVQKDNLDQLLQSDPEVRQYKRYFSINTEPSIRTKQLLDRYKEVNEKYSAMNK